MCVRVVNVKGMNKPEQRAGVCYVGRAFYRWPESQWGNPFRIGGVSPGDHRVRMTREHVLEYFLASVEARKEAGDFDAWIDSLWEACKHGELPLGCWCVNATVGDGQSVVCHAQILAQLLHERFGGQS